jgi:translation initiation factor 3 subunit E
MAAFSSSEKYDLTPRMSPFFDVHMVSPLLDHLSEMSIYSQKVLTKEKIKIVAPTNMIELVEDEYEKFPDDADFQSEYAIRKPLFEERKDKIFDLIDNEPESVGLVSAFFADSAKISELKSSNELNIDFITANHGITFEALESYYKFSKFKYECGMYSDAEDMLGNYLSVTQSSTTSMLGALWGRLACRILQAKWADSLVDLISVKDAIEIRNITPIDQLRQRAWLMHWGLFVYLNRGAEGVDALVDLFSDKAYLQTLENLCPWLLRYLSAAVILSPSKRHTKLRDLLAEISAMQYQYSDPITLFLGSLFDQFDFDEAQAKLKECQELVKNDFFLQIHASKFMHEARMLICEMYCAINRKLDLTMLAEKLQLTDEEAERWMVDMVRGNSSSYGPNLDAKIDSSGKQVIISAPARSAYKQVVESSRDLNTRSGILSTNLEQLVKEQAVYIKNR